MRKVKTGGGWPAVKYTLTKAREVGGFVRLWKAMRSKNACKTCALGMGGQKGGMVNEAGHFPEVCKKSLQAMASDMQGAIRGDFFSTYAVAQMQAFSPRELETCGRITTPLKWVRGENYYQPITWDDALNAIATKLKAIAPDESFWYFSGRSSNEAAFLLHVFARMYGTNNVNNCSFYCHQASGVGLSSSIGTSTATISLDDVDHADQVWIIGGNPASNHPRLMRTLMQVRRRGGKVIVINPVRETGMVNFSVPSDVRSLLFGSEIASLYVQPHIGGDLALLSGIAKLICEMAAHDEQYLNQFCEGWPELQAHLQSLSWSDITARSGVSIDEIQQLAKTYASAQNVVFGWTMGITHHVHGVQNVQAIVNLALLRGMVGREHCGLMPIRGHSNVQGIGSVGVTPKLKQAMFDRLESYFGIKLPTTPGMDTMACMEAATSGKVKVGICLGGNLYGSNPDATYAARAMEKLDLVVYLNTTLNTGHAHGLGAETIILPVLARDEEPQPTTQESMFNYVRLSDGGVARHAGPRSEMQIISELAHRVLGTGGPIEWRGMSNTSRVRAALAKVVPGWEQIDKIDTKRKEFTITGRRLLQPKFPTPSGRARLHLSPLPELSGGDGQLRLMTVRSEGQFNTVVYEEYDLYRGQERRDLILMHPDDIARLGLAPDQPVVVRSEVGELAGVLARAFPEIKAGNVLMYYPEANVLVPRHLDPASKTPAFKNVLVRVEAMSKSKPRAVTQIAAPSNGHELTAPGAVPRGDLKAC